MMYSSYLVAAIKSNGKVLREFGDTVFLPFGAEYSIFLKNMSTTMAEVSITIDGQDVLGGSKIIVNPNSSVDLERFLENNDTGYKFKFIEKTTNIEKHRGNKAEDGLIRISYQFERAYQNTLWRAGIRSYVPPSGTFCGNVTASSLIRQASVSSYNVPTASSMDGITTKDNFSNQQFHTVSSFPVQAEPHVIVLRLKGDNQGIQITKPVDVSRKPKCDCCGRVNKTTAKFCQECGTNLLTLA